MKILFYLKNYLLTFFQKIYRKKKHSKFKEFEKEVIFFEDNKIDNHQILEYFESCRVWKDVQPEIDDNHLLGIQLEIREFERDNLVGLTNYYLAKTPTTI